MGKVGRPSKFSPERVEALIEALRHGNSRTAACALADISYQTFRTWVLEKVAFLEAVEKAESEAEARYLSVVEKAAGDGTWQAAAWWLERVEWRRYGRHDRVDVDITREAERLAAELGGVSAEDLVMEADRLVRGVSR